MEMGMKVENAKIKSTPSSLSHHFLPLSFSLCLDYSQFSLPPKNSIRMLAATPENCE